MRARPAFHLKDMPIVHGKEMQRISNPENEGFMVFGYTGLELEILADMMALETIAPIVITLYGPVQDAETGKEYKLSGHAAVHGGGGFTAHVWTLPYNDLRITYTERLGVFERARVFAELVPGAVEKWQKMHAGKHHPLFA